MKSADVKYPGSSAPLGLVGTNLSKSSKLKPWFYDVSSNRLTVVVTMKDRCSIASYKGTIKELPPARLVKASPATICKDYDCNADNFAQAIIKIVDS